MGSRPLISMPPKRTIIDGYIWNDLAGERGKGLDKEWYNNNVSRKTIFPAKGSLA